jgi:hypothetical protein
MLLARLAPLLAFAVGIVGPAAAEDKLTYPSPFRAWTKADYINFYFAHYNGNTALPHLRGHPQRELFARLVDRENLRAITSKSSTDDERRQNINLVLATMGAVRSAYAYAVLVGEPLQEELMQIQIFLLELLDRSVRLWNVSAGFSREGAWRTTFFGIVHTLGDFKLYSDAQTTRLADAVGRHYPAIAPILSSHDKARLRAELTRLLEAPPSATVEEALSRLLLIVRQAG